MRKLFLIIAGVFLGSSAYAQSFDCGQMDSNISTGSYEFSYKSWSWPHDGRHRLCHCVRNSSNRGLFAEWETTSLKGFVRPGGSSYVMTTHGEPKFTSSKNNLWYGARPTSVEADTLSYDESIVLSAGSYDPLETISLTSAPLSQANKFQNLGQMREAVESYPEILEDVAMEFTSSVDPETGLVEHRCAYQVSGEHWDSAYLIGFKDITMNRIMFGHDEPILIKGGFPSGIEETDERSVSVGRSSFAFEATSEGSLSEEPVTNTSLIFYAPTGFAIAEMPVQFYSTE